MKKREVMEFLGTKKGTIVMTAVILIVAFLTIGLFGDSIFMIFGDSAAAENVISIISVAVFILWGVCGWKSLNAITPEAFLIMPIAGWVAYFVIKGILSIIVGVFVTPYYIAKSISKAINKRI